MALGEARAAVKANLALLKVRMRANRLDGNQALAMEIDETVVVVDGQILSLGSRCNAANAELVEMMADNPIEAIVVELQAAEMATGCDIVSGQVTEWAKVVEAAQRRWVLNVQPALAGLETLCIEHAGS